MQKLTLAILLSAMVCTIPMSGCIETTCDIHAEIDNSLGYVDEVAVMLITKKCDSCPWQVKAAAWTYKGIDRVCWVYDNKEEIRVFFTEDKDITVGDEIYDDIGYDVSKGDFKYTIDEDGIIRDSEGNVYSFF